MDSPLLRRVAMAVVVVAGLILLAGAVSTTRARFVGSTESGGSLSAGRIELSTSAPVEALFDKRGLAPGVDVSRCTEVVYSGTVPDVGIELLAEITGGTGLEDHLDVTIDRGTGSELDCSDFVAQEELLSVPLRLLDRRRPGRQVLWRAAETGDSIVLRVTMSVREDPDAVGREVHFSMLWSAQP